MNQENYCPEHGPYPASYGECPICAGRPSAPRSLSAMEDDTSVAGEGPFRKLPDAEDTVVYGAQRGFSGADDEDKTQLAVPGKSAFAGRGRMAPEAILWVLEGNHRGRWYPVFNNTTIGRKKADLILDDDRVSGTHAKVTLEKGAYLIWDFGSANGTYVNGKRIREATPLQENDRIKIGDTPFVFKVLTSKKKTAPQKTKAKSPAKKSASPKKTQPVKKSAAGRAAKNSKTDKTAS